MFGLAHVTQSNSPFLVRPLPRLLSSFLMCVLLSMNAFAFIDGPTNAPTNAPTKTAAPAPTHNWNNLADMVFRHFTMQQGLPQSSATVLAQDGEGFIWVGTQGGLARWDGYRFRSYLPVPNDPTSLPDNYVLSLFKDKQNRLWIGTNGGGVARYDAQTDSFVRIPIGANGSSHVTVNSIAGDSEGGLWFATRGGLDYFHPDTGAIQHYRHEPNNPNSLPSDFTRAVLVDQQGIIWVGTSKGLVKFDVVNQRFTRISLPIDDNKVQRIISLGSSKDGKLWIGSFDAGAFYLDTKDPAIAPLINRVMVKKPGTRDLVGGSENVHAIRQVADNEVWIGTYGKGILSVNIQTLESRWIKHEPTRQSSLADNAVWSILQDQSGLIWIGSQRGMSLHDPSSHAFVSIYGGENRHHGLAGLDFFSVNGFSNGDIWVGSQNNGVGILEAGSNQFSSIHADDTKIQTALPQSAIFITYPTSDGQIFIGTDKGLYQTIGNTRAVKHLKLSPRNPVMRVATMLQHGDQLLIGGPEGLWQKDLKQSNLDQATQPAWATPIASKFVTDIQQAPDGRIWICTLQDGLYRYDPKNNELLNLAPDPNNKYNLAHRNVSSILFDSRGWLWVAMQGGGLDLLRTPNAKPPFAFEHFGKQQKLPNELVNKVLEDNQGNIWASTDEGFARINPKTMHIDPFVESDGVAITGYWSNSGGRTKDGELIFGGVGGLTVIRPELVKKYAYHPPVVVTNIQLGGKTIAANHAGFSGNKGKKLLVQADANSIVVEFASLDFSAPERNRYAYRLEGYDRNWVETDYTRRLAAYTNLPPGNYRLMLRGSNRNGEWSEGQLTLSIKVLPAWFQTWWAYSMYLLLLACLIFGVVRWRLWRLNKANKTLEQLVQERTRELEQSRKMLEEQSLTDHLTGLRNRRYLNLYIGEDIARVNRSYQALPHNEIHRAALNIDIIFMMVDIDHFKSVNDEFGHAAGDHVLIQTTEILREAVREADTIIRWGGEEFLIVVRHANYLEAEVLAERIRTRIAEHSFTLADGKTLHRTCSIGLTTYPFIPSAVDLFTWEQVVDIADQCLYAAKHGGRNAWIGLFLLGDNKTITSEQHSGLNVEQQIAQGQIVVKTSLPADTKLDWSHGRGK